MAKTTHTYGQLLLIRNDIKTQIQKSPSFYFFNEAKIKSFFGKNHIRLNLANEKLTNIANTHAALDADGNAKIKEQTEKGVKYEFLTAESETAFNEEYNDFINKSITIEI